MGRISYLWNKLIKKLPGSAIRNSTIPQTSRVEARSTVIDTVMGCYSYAGYGCSLLNCKIGNFCSIADNVLIGLGNHPIDWVSTSPAFYYGKDSIPKELAKNVFKANDTVTMIGNDVWIGARSAVKQGVEIGDGAIVGMGSVVTKNVPPYAIVAGVPAKVIGYRFDEEIRIKLHESKWWDMPKEKLKKYAEYMNDPESFISVVEADI